MQLRFDHRVVIVTGAAQGIGRAIAKASVAAGGTVHVADIDRAYTAAKHALVGLTRQLSFALGPHGITVNSIALKDIAAACLFLASDAAGWITGQVRFTHRPRP